MVEAWAPSRPYWRARRKTGFSPSGVAPCVVADSPFASPSQLADRLAETRAHEALGCDGPSDIKKGERPIDDAFIRDVQEGRAEKWNSLHLATSGALA